MEKPKYNTWIRKNKIVTSAILAVLLLVLAALWLNLVISVVAFVLAVTFIYITFMLSYNYYQFSANGGDYQTKIHETIIRQIASGEGKLLDIGSGSGSLIIKAAKAFPNITATGLDNWGSEWSDYSQKLCESNAGTEGVAGRINFVQGSAAKLPFNNHAFDIVISCLTFHEVKDEANKANLLRESLRVLKNGGEFAFMDLFASEKVFGKLNDLMASLNVSKIEAARLDAIMPLPKLLMTKRSLGYAMILKGVK